MPVIMEILTVGWWRQQVVHSLEFYTRS